MLVLKRRFLIALEILFTRLRFFFTLVLAVSLLNDDCFEETDLLLRRRLNRLDLLLDPTVLGSTSVEEPPDMESDCFKTGTSCFLDDFKDNIV